MIKQIPAYIFCGARAAITLSLVLFSLNAYTEEEFDQPEVVPSCVKVCFEERSGKARRGCASICQAQETSCMATGGSFEFQADKYLCSSSENVGIAER